MEKICNYKNYLINGTFSEPNIASNTSKDYKNNEVKGWTFNNGIIINNSKIDVYPTPYPCGNQACSIQKKNSIFQIFSVPKIGIYSLIILYAGRDCCDQSHVGNSLNIILNNKQIKSIIDPSIKNWNGIVIDLNLTNTTNNKLEIIGISQNDRSTAIQVILTDQIQSKSSLPASVISSENVNVDFNYNENAVPVYVLGNYGIPPWKINELFPDKTAKWIWYSIQANVNAFNNMTSPRTIQYLYSNKSGILIDINLNIIIDIQCEVFLNSQQLKRNDNNLIATMGGGPSPGGNNTWNIFPCKILPGENLFEFKVKNDGGPAGLLVSAIDTNNNIVFNTGENEDWKFIPLQINQITTCNLSQPGLITTADKSFPWGCLILNGTSNQYVDIGTTITGMKGLSFGCWFRSNKNGNWVRILDFGNGPNSDNIILAIANNEIKGGLYVTNMDFNNYRITISPNVNDNKWHHLVWTMQPIINGSIWLFYMDNKLISTLQLPNLYPRNIERTKCYIGRSNWDIDPYFSGAISNFVMYQKVLNITEINALYKSMINLNDPDLYIYLPLSTNSVLDTLLNNYAGKVFTLPITKSNIPNENWTCIEEEKNKWINVKMENNMPICMSMDGKNCIEEEMKKDCMLRIINQIVPYEPIICSENENQMQWCNIAKKQLTQPTTAITTNTISGNLEGSSITDIKPSIKALSALEMNIDGESLNLQSLLGEGQILSITNMDDINNLMVGGTFKLKVNLPLTPPYIKGKTFDINKGINPNYFYLCIEKLDNNCNIKASNGNCIQTFADNKKCNIKALTSYTQSNTYRLVLVSSLYVLDKSIPIGKNSDFTLVKINNQLYLKNIQTGYLPSLYSNEIILPIYGDMEVKPNSNVNQIYTQLNNTLCNQPDIQLQTTGTSFVKCNIKQDPDTYLITTKNMGTSSPIRININSDKTISLNLLSFNTYGFPTTVYALTSCNFNVQTYAYIEKMTNALGTFMVNMVCFEDTQNNKSNPKNQLKFVVELINFPNNFIKNNSIFDI